MYVMYDSVDLTVIPASASAVAGYVGGAWPTFPEIVKRWPRAHHLSIAVSPDEDAEFLDVEKGDATPEDCPGWFRRQKARGVEKPGFYASVSVVPQIEAILGAAGIDRSEYRVGSAHYTFIPHLCGPHCGFGLQHAVDWTQWTDRALGRNLDESLCIDSFFAHAKKRDPLAVLTPKEAAAVRHFDQLHQHSHLQPEALKHVRAVLVRFRKETWLAAVKGLTPDQERCQPGWDVHHRRERYKLLLSRTR